MSTDAKPAIQTPIHIYVLWHPRFVQGHDLAANIYRWFRLDTMEGIPVFFRSTNAKDSRRPLPIEQRADIQYVIPLVDAHMVADPAWREWLVELKRACEDPSPPTPKQRMFPVAVDSLAFQAPAELRDLNFIRHDMTRRPPSELDVLLSFLTEVMCRDLRYHPHRGPRGQGGTADEPPSKIKIFLSHAKADGTEVVRRLKEHIQSQTQCETFFDETDIPLGTSFSAVLDKAIESDSAGMIAIHGSQYAERPWCRREIRAFQAPRQDRSARESHGGAFFVPPVVVVENMDGGRVSRNLPELGFAPAVRWAQGSERRIVNTLLREILLGFFHRMLIHNALASRRAQPGSILVNRPPDPWLAQRLIRAAGWNAAMPFPQASHAGTPGGPGRHIYYPGYGLSQAELAALREAFLGMEFSPLSEIAGDEPGSSASSTTQAKNGGRPSKAGPHRVVRLSVGNSSDILDGGYGDQHNRELLLRLLRPLAREGTSILYGGLLPKAAGALSAWEQRDNGGEPFVNFTSTCVHVLIAERDHEGDGTNAGTAPASTPAEGEARLYSMPVWPESEKFTDNVVAQWVDVCSFRPVTPEDLTARRPRTSEGHRPGWSPRVMPKAQALDRSDFDSAAAWRKAQGKLNAEVQAVTDHNDVLAACCLTRMRTMACDEVAFPNLNPHLGGGREVRVLPIAHVFLGGKLTGWGGIAPGIFEEFAAAVRRRQPIFLIGAGRGAAGAIARWLRDAVLSRTVGENKPVQRPPEFTVTACLRGAKNQRLAKVFALWKRQGRLPRDQWDLKEILDVIHDAVDRAQGGRSAESRPDLSKVLNNGLSHEANLGLLDPGASHGTICKWLHEGLRTLGAR